MNLAKEENKGVVSELFHELLPIASRPLVRQENRPLTLAISFYEGKRGQYDRLFYGADIATIDFLREDINFIYNLSPRFDPFMNATYCLDGIELFIARTPDQKSEILSKLEKEDIKVSKRPRTSGHGIITSIDADKIYYVLDFIKDKKASGRLNNAIREVDRNDSTRSKTHPKEFRYFHPRQAIEVNGYWDYQPYLYIPFYFILLRGLEKLNEKPVGLINIIEKELKDLEAAESV